MRAIASVQAGRSLAESLMIDEATVERPDASSTLNTSTGVLTPAAGTEIYCGPCRVRTLGDQNEAVNVFGEASLTTNRYRVWFPSDCDPIEIGDLVTIVESLDPYLTARTMRVVSQSGRSHLMRRDVICEVLEP